MSKYTEYQQSPLPPTRYVMRVPGAVLSPTPSDILGPFYRPGAPFRNDLCSGDGHYLELSLTGRVLTPAGDPVDENCYVEFWHADKRGKYDEAGPGFRGIQQVKPDGSYSLMTLVPGDYDISDPAAPQPHEFRCAHIHAKVWVNGIDVLTTQLYFPDDKYNATDRWFDPRRVIDRGDAKFDFVLDLTKKAPPARQEAVGAVVPPLVPPYWKSHPSTVAEKLAAGVTSMTPITTSDTVDQPALVQAVYCTADGTLQVTLVDDTSPVTIPVFKGLNRLRAKRVYTTGTSGCTPVWSAKIGG